MVSDDTCLSSRKTGRSSRRAPLAATSSAAISTIPGTIDDDGWTKARRTVPSAPLGTRGSIHQRGTGRLVFWHSPPVPSSSPRPLPGVGPFLSSFSVHHPSFLLSLNSRRATARAFPVTFSLVNLLGLSLPPFPRDCSRRFFVSTFFAPFLRSSERPETASGHSALSLIPFSRKNCFEIYFRVEFKKSRVFANAINTHFYDCSLFVSLFFLFKGLHHSLKI